LAAHIIGYTGPVTAEEVERYGDSYDGSPYKAYKESDYVGRMGVEEFYNGALRGERGEVIEEIADSKANRRKLLEKPVIQGANLFLTIDKDVQHAAESALGQQAGAFIVMKPEDGAILAMASYPRFNPNNLRKDYDKLLKDPRSPLLHRAIQGLVPPGSLFKQITTCAALETGAISLGTPFPCPGEMVLGSVHFRCWNEYGHGSLDLEEGIMKSCNCYFFHVGRVTGGNALIHWARVYELGAKTGIDLPGECTGLVTPPRKGALGDVYNLAIGQGKILVTPIQMVRMVAVVANGGWLVRPHVLARITDHNGALLETPLADAADKRKKLPISAEHLRFLRSAFRRVVTDGTASYTKEKDFLEEAGAAGKTGTAQTANKEVNHGWFAGYVPYDHPKLAFVILAERVSGHGGEVCAPILRAFLEAYNKLADQRRMAMVAR
jgi:penicillin-binding protein 2